MTYSISIAEEAENDIRKAFLWYEAQKENLGTRFEAHLSKSVDSIKGSPLKTQLRYGITRVYFLKTFPFGIHFQVDGSNILIVAVFHTSLDPVKWENR